MSSIVSDAIICELRNEIEKRDIALARCARAAWSVNDEDAIDHVRDVLDETRHIYQHLLSER